jgi:Flp pilus assembly protein CpaB
VAVLAGVRATSPSPPATTAVPVLAHDVAPGTVLGAGDVALVDYAPGSVPPGVVAQPAGRTVATAVRRGEPVTATRLVGAPLVAGEGTTVMPVRFPDAAMAALLRAGDEVDLLAVDPQGGEPREVADGVRVLALPPAGGVDGAAVTGDLPGRLTVLAVPMTAVTDVSDAAVRLFLTWTYAH